MKYPQDLIIGFGICLTFIGLIFLTAPQLPGYRFDDKLVARYLRSQDIPKDVPGRLFLSDSDIHIAAGYLYVNGYDPTAYNFQHPPFIKYLYGLSTLVTKNPFLVQFLLGMVFLIETYAIGVLVFRSRVIGVIGAILVLVDPLFRSIATEALLDLGQAVLLLGFMIMAIRFPKAAIAQGVLLGLAAASKFWTPVLVVAAITYGYNWYRMERLELSRYCMAGLAAVLAFSLPYIHTALVHSPATPYFYQAKMLKYWFHHSTASLPGANVLLFMTGIYQPWWGTHKLEFSPVWNLMWPLSLIASAAVAWRIHKRKLKQPLLFAGIFPVVYLLSLAIQAPFVRYFLIILPWSYLCLGYWVNRRGKQWYKKLNMKG